MNSRTHTAKFDGTFNGIAWTAEAVGIEAVDTFTVVTTVTCGRNAYVYTAMLRADGDRSDTVLVIEQASPGLNYHPGSVVTRIRFGSNRREWVAAFKSAMRSITNEAVWAAY